MRKYEDAWDHEVAEPRLSWNFVICMAIAAGVIWLRAVL